MKTDNVTVMGTSNSTVRHGYIQVLRAAYPNVTDLAIGSSTGVLHGFRSHQLAAAPPGIGIYEHCVNEAQFQKYLGFSEDIHISAMESFVGYCGDRGIRPVILVIPAFWPIARDGPTRKRHIAFAERHSLPYFDCFVLHERIFALRPGYEALGRHAGAHPDARVLRVIGHALVAAFDKIDEAAWTMTPPREAWRFDSIVADGDHIRRSTKLEDISFAVVEPGQAVTAPIDRDAQIVGVVFNAGKTNGTVRVDAGDARTKFLTTNFFTLEREFFPMAWPFERPLAATRAHVEISCLPLSADEADERNVALSMPADLSHPRLEIAALITRQRRAGVTFPVHGGPIDLVSTLSDTDILRAVDAEFDADAAEDAPTG